MTSVLYAKFPAILTIINQHRFRTYLSRDRQLRTTARRAVWKCLLLNVSMLGYRTLNTWASSAGHTRRRQAWKNYKVTTHKVGTILTRVWCVIL